MLLCSCCNVSHPLRPNGANHSKQAKAVVDPFSYDEYRKQKIKEKIDAQREKRITVAKKRPKVWG